MRLVLYGGSFDPIHHGHLLLARDALETLAADRVIFIPAAISPHKLTRQPTDAAVRRDLVAAALEGEPSFLLDDRELHRAGPSFTYDTVAALAQDWPGAELLLLIGQDNVPLLHTWHRIQELRQLARFVILHRGEGEPGTPVLPRRVDISSTEVRARVARGQSIRYLVSEPVRLLIEQHRLYRPRP